MALTYKAIATVTVGSGGASNIEFTSIPGTYTDLCVLASLRNNDNTYNDVQVYVYFNGSTSSYSRRTLYSATTYAGSTNASNSIALFCNIPSFTSSTFSNSTLYILNYAGSNYKSFSVDNVTENNSGTADTQYMSLVAGLWSNTAAITSVKLTPNAGSFVQYSTATLYGIKNS